MKKSNTDELYYNLSEEEYSDLNKKIEEFQNSLFSYLAGTANYGLVPTVDKLGNPYSEQQLNILINDCRKKNSTILYATEYIDFIRLVNPKTLKTSIVYFNGEIH